jgi:hypothetical protein
VGNARHAVPPIDAYTQRKGKTRSGRWYDVTKETAGNDKKQVSKENVREERRKTNTLAKIDENSVPCLDGG